MTGTVAWDRPIVGILGTVNATGLTGTVDNSIPTAVTGVLGVVNAAGLTGTVAWDRVAAGTIGVVTATGLRATVSSGARVTSSGGGGWIPQHRRKTRKEVHAERIKLGILPPDIVKAAKKAAAVVADTPDPIRAYQKSKAEVNKVFLDELGATKMLPDYRNAIMLQIRIMQDEEDTLMLFM
ncbi:MAG: hypothetical protein E4H01_15210 [Lysobacterales bacterium]|nr:MAG: hypothetical protein E4H01_15210 [Xanthomonadales bacterium]